MLNENVNRHTLTMGRGLHLAADHKIIECKVIGLTITAH